MASLRLHHRLGTKLLALLFLSSAIPIGVAAVLTFLSAKTVLTEDATQLLAARADQLVSELDGFHRGYLRAVRRLSSLRVIASFVGDPQAPARGDDSVRSILQSYEKSDAQIRSVTLFDAQAGVVMTTDSDPRTRGFPASSRRYVRAAMKGQTEISDVFLEEGSVEPVPVITYFAPVFGSDGNAIGAIALSVHATAFWEAVRAGNGRAGENSFSVLYDSSGIRIAHSFNSDEVFRPGGPLDAAVIDAAIAEHRFGDRTMALLAAPSVMLEEFTRARDAILSEREVFRGYSPANGKSNLGVARRLKTVRWTLFCIVPEASIERPVQSLLESITLAGALVIAVALGAGLLGARRILSPIKDLSEAAEAIARGEKNIRVSLATHDELGVLGERFNAMAAAIADAHEGLEARVRERTLELERLNQELQSQKGELLAQQDELRAQQSELQAKNREVAHADRLKSEFLTNMSHELRTPLNSIIGFSELLVEEGGRTLSARHRGYIENVLDSGRHLLKLINDILDLSKIEAGRAEDELIVSDPSLAVAEACTLLGAPAAKKRISLQQDCRAKEAVFADSGKLRQVLLNLLSNAIKFSPEGSAIEVSTEDLGPLVRFSVRDHGPGIEPSLMPRLFQPFTQGESPLSKKHEGTGLGLAISKRLVEQHGGVLEVETKVGQGSTFRFTIPTGKRTQLTIRSGRLGAVQPVVFLVEDNPVMAPQLRELLENNGYSVAQLENSSDGLEQAEQLQPAAIVLDPDTERRDGFYLLDELQRRAGTADIPVVLTSAPGAFGFVPKPIDKRRLIRSCERTVAPSSLRPVSVLAIDDDPRVGTLLRSILEPAGYRLILAQNGAEGIEAARRELPDLIIVDLVMPDMSGFEVLQALAADDKTRGCPVIVMTAAELSDSDRARLKAQARALAEKGNFTRAELLSAVKRVTGTEITAERNARAARILVVDDHDLNRDLARSILESMGHEVLCAEDGEEGVRVARKEQPDLILMDLAMPRKDGYTATRELKALGTAGIPIVALTALAMRGDEEKAYAAGVNGYLTKPLDRRALAETIGRLLDG